MTDDEQEARDWYAPPKRADHCTRSDCCWERSSRVLTQDINLAEALVRFRVAKLDVKSDQWPFHKDSLADLERAVQLLRDLHNSQWRQMTRPIFTWNPQPKAEQPKAPTGRLTALNLADLGL